MKTSIKVINISIRNQHPATTNARHNITNINKREVCVTHTHSPQKQGKS